MDGFLPGRGNKRQLNVLGNELEPCNFGLDNTTVVTGFYRDNCCNTGVDDVGLHTVCCIMTNEFLSFSRFSSIQINQTLTSLLKAYSRKKSHLQNDRCCANAP